MTDEFDMDFSVENSGGNAVDEMIVLDILGQPCEVISKNRIWLWNNHFVETEDGIYARTFDYELFKFSIVANVNNKDGQSEVKIFTYCLLGAFKRIPSRLVSKVMERHFPNPIYDFNVEIAVKKMLKDVVDAVDDLKRLLVNQQLLNEKEIPEELSGIWN